MSRKTAYGDDVPDPNQDTGRKGYLEPDEPSDGTRMRISFREFWADESERLTYEHAVETNPRRKLPDGRLEPPGSYILRIAQLVAGRLGPIAKSMPRPRRWNDGSVNDRVNDLKRGAEEGQAEP